MSKAETRKGKVSRPMPSPRTSRSADFINSYSLNPSRASITHSYTSQTDEDTLPSRPTSSVRFSEEVITFEGDGECSEDYPTIKTLSGSSYSEDFESQSKTPRTSYSYVETLDSTAKSEATETYSNDFETDTTGVSPRRSRSSLCYTTDTFESESECPGRPDQRWYSESFESTTTSVPSYTETFDSDDVSSESKGTEDSRVALPR